jgi:1-acylglycerone phosphate reductase
MAKKTILIIGCSAGGIGDSLAQEFHHKGLRGFATAHSLPQIAHLADLGIETLTLDVTSSTSIADVATKVAAETVGALDYLLKNSGDGYSMPITDVDVSAGK